MHIAQPLEQQKLLLEGCPFKQAEALAAGISRRQLGKLVRAGVVRQPFYGVYVDARVTDDLRSRAEAVALVLPAGAVVARQSAAWLRGVDTRSPAEQLLPPPLECLVPAGCTPPRRHGLRSYSATLPSEHVDHVCAIPVTSMNRTAVDLARYLEPHMGLAVVDHLLHTGAVDAPGLATTVDRCAGERWMARARRVVDLAEPATESYGESWLRLRTVDAGMPRPTPQLEIFARDGRFLGRADLADVGRRLVIEYDGQEHHSTEQDMAHDTRRRANIEAEGWRVLVVGRNEVLGRSMLLERALGEAYSLPVLLRRRTW